jgi:Lrp/AsnC family transcriptional regulator for asnA, asnC and gidA
LIAVARRIKKYNNSKENSGLNGPGGSFQRINGIKIDKLDVQLIELLLAGHDTKYIATKTRTPLSTVQRRCRKLFENNLLTSKVELNYEKLGYKRGFLHIYVANGQVDKIGETVANRQGIISVAVHIGNSDLVALFIYKDSKQLLNTISETKLIEGIDRVLWSEEVYFIPMKEGKFNILNI